jgi:hypothetical protein
MGVSIAASASELLQYQRAERSPDERLREEEAP